MASREARKPRILIAGGGVAGLVLALAAKRRGFEVRVFEKDLSAVRGEGQYRGPIILHGNALAVLAAIDPDVARQVLAAACVTGDRLNGLADGITGDWYRVFVGFNQYFVACDIGCGKMQWYGFHKEPPGSKRKRLLELYEGWCSEVVALISRTSESMILRRDLYDRDMIYTWGRGRITLVGDAAHAMQPALGQSGCMAIEDCYQLVLELEKAYVKCDCHDKHADEIALAIARYERKRILRVGIVHAVTRMAARMSSTYRPYLDFGPGCLSFLTNLRIPNPAIYGAQFVVGHIIMPIVMTWMLNGHGVW
uniref:FAD-binding domain-containing protein n=1 Tax=Ananas comosus var. bracteatus TaxID=296719 RepID=A0A6V7QS07_ANACO